MSEVHVLQVIVQGGAVGLCALMLVVFGHALRQDLRSVVVELRGLTGAVREMIGHHRREGDRP